MPVLTIPTGTVTGQVVDLFGRPVVGALVQASLRAGPTTPQTISPAGQTVPSEVTAVTDVTGAWSLALIPNSNITPANTTYVISVPGMPDVQVSLPDTASHSYLSIAVSPTGATLVTAGQIITGPITLSGGIAGPNPWVDISAWGGRGDNFTDNTTALATALAQLPSTGGTIFFPPSASPYLFASAWNLVGKSFVRFKGGGPASTGGSPTSSRILFTTTSGPLVSASGSTGVEFEDLYFQWPAAFTGTVMDLSGSQVDRSRGCFFEANGGGTNAARIIGLDNATIAVIERCLFHNATVAIQGIATGGHFSNAVTIRDCYFSTSTGDISTAHIQNPGQGWKVEGNTFEMGTAVGTPNAIGQNLGGSLGVAVVGNWFGDAGSGVLTFLDINGDGWLVAGNILGSNSNVSSMLINLRSGASGLSVTGNRLQNSGIGITVGGSNSNVFVAGNRWNGVPTRYSGAPSNGLTEIGNPNGGFQVGGSLQRSTQSPAEAVLVSGVDPSNGENVSVTLTAARLVGAPINPNTGQRLYFTFTQGGAGAFAVTWNAVFKVTWSDAGNATGKISTIGFWYNGTNWVQLAAQAPYV